MVSRATLGAITAPLLLNVAEECIIGGTGPKPICERFWEHDAVALVDVVAIDETNSRRRVTLRVVEVFRGQPPAEVVSSHPLSAGANPKHRFI